MNVWKTCLIVCSLAFSQWTFGQGREEVFSLTGDPVKSVQVYPNPATEFLTVTFEAPVARKVKFTVHNIIGSEIEVESEVIDEFEVKIKVKDLHEGYYFLSVQNGATSQKSTHKFLKR